MNQFKRAKVIMLPTNSKSNIQLNVIHNHLFSMKDGANIPSQPYQHLYIISSSEIKEGDWCLNISKNIIYQKDKIPMDIMWKKIIATTDTSLTYNYYDSDSYGIPQVFKLPQPSQQFIEKYIESYNKGEIITDVLLEYEKNVEMRQGYPKPSTANSKTEWNYDKITSYNLKINTKDNTITIKKLKDSWNREEVIKILKSFEKDIENSIDSDDDGNTFNNINSDKWIEKNL